MVGGPAGRTYAWRWMLIVLFAAVVISMVVYGVINIRKALGTPKATAIEVEFAGAATGGSNA